MRTFTLKGLFVTAVFMLLGCLAIHAADGDLITKQITIKLEEAGTLPSKIGDTKKYKITNLKSSSTYTYNKVFVVNTCC